MKQLKLISQDKTPAPPEKPKPWEQSYAGIFFYEYKKATGEECRLGYGALKKMLRTFAEKNWIDEETGELQLPSLDAWTEEVLAFFEDSFAAKERGFHFSYLLKQFGSFKKFQPVKRTTPSDSVITHTCPSCGTVARAMRSAWERHKNKLLKCAGCREQYAVNDVLNSFQTVGNFIQNFQK